MGAAEQVPEIRAAAVAEMRGDLGFPAENALAVLRACVRHGIAVLGAEVFKVMTDGWHAAGSWSFDAPAPLPLDEPDAAEWCRYVQATNSLAEEFLAANPIRPGWVYDFNMCSREEFAGLARNPHG